MNLFDKMCNLLSEVIGTFLLIFLGCMGCVHTPQWDNNLLTLCINFGLVVMISIQSFGVVSGSHINPSVTVVAVIYKRVSIVMGGLYVVAQCLGACLGYGLLLVVLPREATKGLCITKIHPDFNIWQGLCIEFVLTAALAWFCCGVWDPRNAKFHDSVSLRFGLAISSLAMTGGRFTGASMNPARTLGPAIWNLDFKDHWVYWVGPLAGSALATTMYKYLFRKEVEVKSAE